MRRYAVPHPGTPSLFPNKLTTNPGAETASSNTKGQAAGEFTRIHLAFVRPLVWKAPRTSQVDQLPQRAAGVLSLQRCPPDWPAGLKHRGHNIRACLGNAQPSGSAEGVFEEIGDSAADHGKVAWLYPAIRLALAN